MVLAVLAVGVGIAGWIAARADSAHSSPASHHAPRAQALFTPSVLPQEEKATARTGAQAAETA
ncbi:MAG TPA: hypothetical protein VKT32_05840, partial [Chthonomonadaceae bacterium]|nr:hypothetical protein [Chthonomonadaceae bacterium]